MVASIVFQKYEICMMRGSWAKFEWRCNHVHQVAQPIIFGPVTSPLATPNLTRLPFCQHSKLVQDAVIQDPLNANCKKHREGA